MSGDGKPQRATSNSFLLEGVRHLSFGGCAQYHHMQGPTAVSVTANGWQSDLRISLVEWFFFARAENT